MKMGFILWRRTLALTKNPKKIENYNIFIKEEDMAY